MKEIPALELRDVSYVGNGKKILLDINWSVRSGEHWAILGPNGSGKTTLLKIACGYIWPNAGGEVVRRGRLLTNLPELRKSIGWVTSTLATQIPEHEKVLRTVVSGRFAQIGLLEQFGGNANSKRNNSGSTLEPSTRRCCTIAPAIEKVGQKSYSLGRRIQGCRREDDRRVHG